jgi:hypothetical protein
MRYRLRTLMVLLAVGPPLFAGSWCGAVRWQEWQQRETWEDVGGPGAIGVFQSIGCFFDEEGNAEDTLLDGLRENESQTYQ